MYCSNSKQHKFKVAGVSNHDRTGELKLRFGKDLNRVKHLIRKGHTNVLMCELDHECNSVQAILAIKDMPEFSDPAIQDLFKVFLAKNNK